MKLIVNADDFGLTLGVSKGIIKGINEGIVTDTSALANSNSFEESAKLAIENGITTMGVHLTITFSEPVLDVEKVKSIVDENGRFFRKPYLIPKNYDKDEVKAELNAQIEKFLATGLKLNHLDTHHGFSIVDSEMLDIIIGLAKEYNVPMRRDDVLASRPWAKDKILSSGVKVTDYICADFSKTYVSEEFILEKLIEYKESDYIIEIAGHPGFIDEKLKDITSFVSEREKDLAVFTSEKVKSYINNNNINLISYSEL